MLHDAIFVDLSDVEEELLYVVVVVCLLSVKTFFFLSFIVNIFLVIQRLETPITSD